MFLWTGVLTSLWQCKCKKRVKTIYTNTNIYKWNKMIIFAQWDKKLHVLAILVTMLQLFSFNQTPSDHHIAILFFFFYWDSLHASLNSHYEAWSYKKKNHKKITAYRKSVYKEPTVKRGLLILDLKPLRWWSKESIL